MLNRHDRMLIRETERMLQRPRKTRMRCFGIVSFALVCLGLLSISGQSGCLPLLIAALCGGLIGSSVERLVCLRMLQLKK